MIRHTASQRLSRGRDKPESTRHSGRYRPRSRVDSRSAAFGAAAA